MHFQVNFTTELTMSVNLERGVLSYIQAHKQFQKVWLLFLE